MYKFVHKHKFMWTECPYAIFGSRAIYLVLGHTVLYISRTTHPPSESWVLFTTAFAGGIVLVILARGYPLPS